MPVFHWSHLRNPRFALACLVVGCCLAAWTLSPFTPEELRRAKLALSPLCLGLPFLFLCGIHEAIVRRSKSSYVSFVSSLFLLLPAGICLLHLAFAAFRPTGDDDLDTMFWPLIAVVHFGLMAAVSLVFALLAWWASRLGDSQAR